MSTLSALDVAWCVRRLKREVRELLEKNPRKLVVAGGFIRSCIAGEEIKDVDLFVDSEATARALAVKLGGCDRRIIETGNALTVTGMRPAVQFVYRWTYDDPAKVADSFDFTVCAAAIWFDGNGWDSRCDDLFYEDLAARRLRYRNPIREEAVGGSLLRVLKYYQRGYRVTMPALADVLARVFEQIKNTSKANDDLPAVILGILREVDPNIDIPIAEEAAGV